MKRFHAAAKHLRPPREISNVAHSNTGFAKQLGSATGGKNLDAESCEPLRKFRDTCLIKHADERALHRHVILPKKKSTTVYARGGKSESGNTRRRKFRG
jgi:hypothetical protein